MLVIQPKNIFNSEEPVSAESSALSSKSRLVDLKKTLSLQIKTILSKSMKNTKQQLR
jgi:hypothetical protein